MNSPLLWYVNRSSGMVLLVLFTLSLVLGVVGTRRRVGRRVPVFALQSLHRNVSLLALALLAAHVTSAVVDTYVDIRWWQALVPWGATYRPVWLELGVVSLDVAAVVAATALLRQRLLPRGWRVVHVAAYAAWVSAVGHAVGIGTDLRGSPGRWADRWAWLTVVVCVGGVLIAVAWRLLLLRVDARRARRRTPVLTGAR